VAQGLLAASVHDMVLDAAPGLVLAPPRASPPAPPVCVFQISVCAGSAAADTALPSVLSVSMTNSPDALATATEGALSFPPAEPNVPSGVAWST
jgi:hypothetical protein